MFAVVGMVKEEEARTGKSFDWEAYRLRGAFGHDNRFTLGVRREDIADELGVHPNRLTEAAQILRELPDVAEQLLAGTIGIRTAREEIAKRKTEAAANEAKLNTLDADLRDDDCAG